MGQKHKRLDEYLLETGVITDTQLDKARIAQSNYGGKLMLALSGLDILTEEIISKKMSEMLSMPFQDLSKYKYKPDVIKILPELISRKYRVLLLEEYQDKYLLAMSDPTDLLAYDKVSKYLKKPFDVTVVTPSDLDHAVDLIFRRQQEISGFAEALSEEIDESAIDLADLEIDAGADEKPVVRLLQSLFTDAVKMRASDIHIEPGRNFLRIRQRIDGLLQENIIREANIITSLNIRLKLMAGLDITEHRLPQDGRFGLRVNKSNIDVRLSTVKTQFGESIVMRLLNHEQIILGFKELGMPDNIQKKLNNIIARPFGMLLVTGPTGSGKTTTLYTTLDHINDPTKKILTAEDPVEYYIDRVNQIQIQEKIGLTFDAALNTMLRHDPDVIMVGEIRDHLTAEIALRASLTGHLVLATLHTNNAASTAFRLVGMGVDVFLVANSLAGVLAQRLVRRICDNCKRKYELTKADKHWIKNASGTSIARKKFFQGKGCTHCNNTGFKGRVGVFELLEIDESMIEALQNNSPQDFYKAVEKSKQHVTLIKAAIDLAIQGITSVDEVWRVIGQVSDDYNIDMISTSGH